MIPAVSVLIPCLGQSQFLAEAVASVRAQTFTDWEIVIVASDDASRAAAWPLLDQRVRLVTHPPTGVCDARNVAARVSRGHWLLSLDADDKLDPNNLRESVRAIGTDKYAIAYAGLRPIGRVGGEWCPSYDAALMRRQNCLPNSSLHTRALWEAVGGWDVAMIGFEDWAYWIACTRHNPHVTQLPGAMMTLRLWGGSRETALAPWKAIWEPMIHMRMPDLYPQSQEDRRIIATLGQTLRPRLEAQLASFPDNAALREWLGLIRDAASPTVEPMPVRQEPGPIPKKLHVVWIGPHDPPLELIQTWRDYHPSWEFKLWSDHTRGWVNQVQIDRMKEWNGKADLMRYEILLREGGVCVDADSRCVRPLDEGDFLDNVAFTSYENESYFPGLVTCTCMGSVAGSAVMRACVERVARMDMNRPAWDSTGPGLITRVAVGDARGDEILRRANMNVAKLVRDKAGVVCAPLYPELRIYPARHFLPNHYTKVVAPGDAVIYAEQLWGGTLGYDRLRKPCQCSECGSRLVHAPQSPQGEHAYGGTLRARRLRARRATW
jgi:hypothetical protein